MLKKLLLAITALLVSISASAVTTLYVVGDGTLNGSKLSSDPSNPNVLTTTTNNVFEFTVENISWIKFSDTKGDWDKFNGNGICIDGKEDYTISSSELGTTKKLWYGYSHNINPPDKDKYKYKITLGTKNSNSNSTIIVDKVYTYAIHTSCFGNAQWESVDMTESSNGKWSLSERHYESGKLGIKKLDSSKEQVDWISASGSTNIEIGKAMNCKSNGSDFQIEAGTYTLTFDPAAMTLTVTGKVDEIIPDPVTYTIYFDNTAGWKDVYLYTYENEELGGWPGSTLPKNNDGLYYWQFESVTIPTCKLIFHNNNGSQTANNVVFKDGETYNNGGWNLNGHLVDTNGDWGSKKFTKNEDGSFSLTCTVTRTDGEFTLSDDYGNHFKPANQNDENKLYVGNDVILNTKEGSNGTYGLAEGTYTFTWNPETGILHVFQKIDYPKSLYIYGYLNNLYWKPDNNVELIQSETPGVYTAQYVDISGQWSADDIKEVPSRKEFESTKDENYIAFYDHIIESQGVFNSTPKYSTTYGDNEEISDSHNVANIKYGLSEINFKVPEGIYNITVDLTNMTVTFVEVEKKTVELVWYQGGHGDYEEATMLPEDRQDEHSLVFGDEKPDILQVGIGTNPTHRVARMVEYEVWYREPNYDSAPKAIKRLANEETPDYAAQHYREAIPVDGDNDGDYTVIGSSEYGDNHLIQLNKAGDYAIIATVDVSKDELKEYNEVTPNTLLVSVAQAKATVYFQNQSAPFPAEDDYATLEEALSFGQELVLGKDFTISIKAKNDDKEWAVPNNAEDLDASYQAQLTENLYSQYKDLGKNIKVDGFYLANQENVDVKTDDNLKYNVLIDVPCSGVYEVTVAPVANGNYKFDAITSKISIYPNLQAKFGKDYGFNIDRYMFADDDAAKAGKIEFPTEKFDYHIREAFIPGSYFVNYFSTEPNSVKTMSVNPDNYRKNYSDQCYVDLGEDFTNKGSEGTNLEIYVAKNGATNHYTFKVVPTDGNGNVSTGVEGIEAVDVEAEYYNLQGVKVSNPEKGIYIKVVNGKAQKVLVK